MKYKHLGYSSNKKTQSEWWKVTFEFWLHRGSKKLINARSPLFIHGVFMSFTSFFKVYINIREYAIDIIYISDHRKIGTCLSFNVVPYLMLYDK